jgi:hypothetical protein
VSEQLRRRLYGHRFDRVVEDGVVDQRLEVHAGGGDPAGVARGEVLGDRRVDDRIVDGSFLVDSAAVASLALVFFSAAVGDRGLLDREVRGIEADECGTDALRGSGNVRVGAGRGMTRVADIGALGIVLPRVDAAAPAARRVVVDRRLLDRELGAAFLASGRGSLSLDPPFDGEAVVVTGLSSRAGSRLARFG